ncbi:DMP19 family protein [Phaeovulum sp. W22_SRMD_FR3]|uniref:DMP19 family protein n=1 Tax=Phaeovulum sp. W22_SRMD_FR3 TaxID=3240274 RepID=UPI003F9C1F07
MPVLKVARATILKCKPTEPVSYQICDCFEDYFPQPIEQHLRTLNTRQPVLGLQAQIARGEVTRGQLLLYTTVCFTGQIMNGGLEGFLDNCPGLIADAALVLREHGAPAFSAAFDRVAAPYLRVLDAHRAAMPEGAAEVPDSFWQEIEAAYDQLDLAAAEEIDAIAYAPDRDADAKNWFHALEARVLRYVLDHPAEFQEA